MLFGRRMAFVNPSVQGGFPRPALRAQRAPRCPSLRWRLCQSCTAQPADENLWEMDGSRSPDVRKPAAVSSNTVSFHGRKRNQHRSAARLRQELRPYAAPRFARESTLSPYKSPLVEHRTFPRADVGMRPRLQQSKPGVASALNRGASVPQVRRRRRQRDLNGSVTSARFNAAGGVEPVPFDSALHGDIRAFMKASEAKAIESATASGGKLCAHETSLMRNVFPRICDFREAGRTDLLRRIKAAGGSRAVARAMGLLLSGESVTDYQDNLGVLLCEIRAFVEMRDSAERRKQSRSTAGPQDSSSMKTEGAGNATLFPTADELRMFGRLDIIAGVRCHGGVAKVASQLGMKLQRGRKPVRAEDSVAWLSARFEGHCHLPTNKELIDAGELDTLRHILAAGGREAVAHVLKLDVSQDRTIFSEDMFSQDVCESSGALEFNTRVADIPENGEVRGECGGAVLDKDGGRRRQAHHYHSFDVLKAELMCFIFDSKITGIMPTARQLIDANRRDLVRAMQMHGGQKHVADRLGLVRQSQGRRRTQPGYGF